MNTNVSGSFDSPVRTGDSITELLENIKSDDPPWGLLIFERDGTVSSICGDASIIGEENSRDIMMALDFAHYAFDRPDWMIEYIKSLQAKKIEESKPQLRLIRGGLEEED